MESNPHPWLWHPEGFVVYRMYSTEHKALVYNFAPAFTGGYFDWRPMVQLKGLKPDDFRNY